MRSKSEKFQQIKSNLRNWSKNNITLLYISIISLMFFFLVGVPFFASEMTQRDMDGHIFLTKFTAEFLLFDFRGWIPFNNLGHPIGTQYPFLPHYIVAILSSLGLSEVFWWKVIIILSLIVLPFSYFYFSKKILYLLFSISKHSTKKQKRYMTRRVDFISFGTTVIYLFIISIFPSTIGGSLKATFEIGLITNFISLPLLYFLLGFLIELQSKKNLTLFYFSSLFISIILLSHTVTGLVAGLITFLLWLGNILNGEKTIKSIIKNGFTISNNPFFFIGIIGLSTTSFFYVPYIMNQNLISEASSLSSDSLLVFGIFLGIFFVFISNIKRIFSSKVFANFMLLILLLITLPLLEVIFRQFGIELKFGFVHFYRLIPFVIYLIIPFVIFSIYSLIEKYKFADYFFNFFCKIRFVNSFIKKTKFINKKNKYFIIYSIGISISLIGLLYSQRGIRYQGYNFEKFNSSTLGEYLGGNILQMYSYSNIYDLHKYPQYRAISEEWKNFTSIGQFEEVGFLNAYANTIPKSLDTEFYQKQQLKSDSLYIEQQPISKINQDIALELFNIEYAYVTDSNSNVCIDDGERIAEISSRTIENGNLVTKNKTLNLCKFNDKDFNEVVNLSYLQEAYFNSEDTKYTSLRAVNEKNWKEEVKNWWFSDEKISSLLIETKESLEDKENDVIRQISTFRDNESYGTDLNWDNDFQGFTINLPKSKDFFIIKVQYDPRWKAYNKKTGEELEIYRLSPSIIGLKSNNSEEVYFKYTFNSLEKNLLYYSLATSVFVFLVMPIAFFVIFRKGY